MAHITITVGGTTRTLPDPKLEGLGVSKNKIWSSNAGRDAKGNYAGSIIAIKNKLELSWATLKKSDALIILNAVNTTNATFTVKYDDLDGSKTFTGYAGDFSYTVVDYSRWWVKDCKISLIEV